MLHMVSARLPASIMAALLWICALTGAHGSQDLTEPRLTLRRSRLWHAMTESADDSAGWPCDTVHTLLYMPSDWERAWAAQADTLFQANRLCARMQEEGNKSATWLHQVQEHLPGAGKGYNTPPTSAIFSYFDRVCTTASGQQVPIRQYVEPLVGHMRHPYGLPECVPSGQTRVDVQSRDYILFGGASASTLARLYPGRKYLFDAGTRNYASSLDYLFNTYAAMGIQFDQIFAWEMKPFNHIEYWAGVPDDAVPRLHLYNTPVNATPGSKMNPLRIIRQLYRPGDLIVFKLDIDDDLVETSLVDQIAADSDLESMISEMFFEKHYHAKEMESYFKVPATKYPAALNKLAQLRRLGLHIHYWP